MPDVDGERLADILRVAVALPLGLRDVVVEAVPVRVVVPLRETVVEAVPVRVPVPVRETVVVAVPVRVVVEEAVAVSDSVELLVADGSLDWLADAEPELDDEWDGDADALSDGFSVNDGLLVLLAVNVSCGVDV